MTGCVFVLIVLKHFWYFSIHCIVCFIISNTVFVRPISLLLLFFYFLFYFYFFFFFLLLFFFFFFLFYFSFSSCCSVCNRKLLLSGIPSNWVIFGRLYCSGCPIKCFEMFHFREVFFYCYYYFLYFLLFGVNDCYHGVHDCFLVPGIYDCRGKNLC